MKDDLTPTYPEKPHIPSVFKRLERMQAMGMFIPKDDLDKVYLMQKEMRGVVHPNSHIQIILKNVLEDTKDFIIKHELVCPEEDEIAFEFNHNVTYFHEILHRTWRWTPGKKPKKFENEEEIVEILAQYITWLLFGIPEIYDSAINQCRQLLRNVKQQDKKSI